MNSFWPFSYYRGVLDTTAAGIEASEAKRSAGEARRDVQSLAVELDRTQLACAAMWSILQEKLQISEEDLLAKMNEIDLSDGKLDGKVSKGAVACPKCNRTISRRLPKCIYCGQPIMHDPFA